MSITRREFVVASSAAAIASGAAVGGASPFSEVVKMAFDPPAGDAHRGPCVVASGNGLAATARAMELMNGGADPAEAVVAGVKIVEDDPKDDSVGYGGLPNEDGVIELDASVMHGPTHKSGAVASLRNIKNPAAVALLVLRRTDHCLIVGEGALRFARAHGFKEEDLHTENSRREWLKWKENTSKEDDWLGDDQIDRWKSDPKDVPRAGEPMDAKKAAMLEYRRHYGTVHVAAVDKDGDVGSCTSTSGLSWKIPGRVGDSPIIGAGNFCDNGVGCAGATGRGEAVIVNLCAYAITREMENGVAPTQACLNIAKRIVDRTREKRNLDAKGRPNFDVKLYALRKDGAYGSASIHQGMTFAVHDGTATKSLPCAWLFDKN